MWKPIYFSEHIVKFKRRCLYILIPVQMKYGSKLPLQCKFCLAFSVVNVPYSLGSMKFLFHIQSPFTLACYYAKNLLLLYRI